MATYEELLAQAYGNVVNAGQALTTNLPAIPTANVANISPAVGQATGMVQNFANTMPNYFNQGVGALGQASNAAATSQATVAGTMGAYDPQSYKAFMNPFQDAVVDSYTKEMQRNFDIANQNRSAQAVTAGAFGGDREGVVQAEAQRGFSDQLGRGIAGLLSTGYGAAQQQAQNAFENQQARGQTAAQIQQRGGDLSRGIGQMFGQFGVNAPQSVGNLATTLSSLGITEQQAQQSQFNQAYQNALNQYLQPFQALQFQSGLVQGAPTMPTTPVSMGNPLLAGIGALGQAF